MSLIDFNSLKQRIAIFKREKTTDELGGAIIQKQLLHLCWANVAFKPKAQRFSNPINAMQNICEFTIRYKAGLGVQNCIEYNGHTFDVQYIEALENAKWQKITTTHAEVIL